MTILWGIEEGTCVMPVGVLGDWRHVLGVGIGVADAVDYGDSGESGEDPEDWCHDSPVIEERA